MLYSLRVEILQNKTKKNSLIHVKHILYVDRGFECLRTVGSFFYRSVQLGSVMYTKLSKVLLYKYKGR